MSGNQNMAKPAGHSGGEGGPDSPAVLIVDDSGNHRTMCSLFLKNAGYRVHCAENGAQGIDLARSLPPDVILLDIMMPVMDGHGMLELLKADRRLAHVPVIMVTVESPGSDMLKAFEAGASDYLNKPVDMDELLARVKLWVGIKKRHEQLETQIQRLREQKAFLKTEIARRFDAAEVRAAANPHPELKAPGALAGSVAHEFNNLFFRVMGYVELALAETGGNASTRAHLENALAAAGQVRQLIGAIPTFTPPGPPGEFKAAVGAKAARPKIEGHVMASSGEHILIVDDEEAIVNLQKQILERFEYTITSSTSSIEALHAFRSDPDKYQLVITDMVMPEKTGDQLARDLLAIRPDIPIILCTGWSEPINEKQAMALGIRSYLKKPVARLDLVRAVRDVLNGNENGNRAYMAL